MSPSYLKHIKVSFLKLDEGRILTRSTVSFDRTLCFTILYHTILHYTILYYTIPYYTILYYTILYYTILYYIILYYTIFDYTVIWYTISYHTILFYQTYWNFIQNDIIKTLMFLTIPYFSCFSILFFSSDDF